MTKPKHEHQELPDSSPYSHSYPTVIVDLHNDHYYTLDVWMDFLTTVQTTTERYLGKRIKEHFHGTGTIVDIFFRQPDIDPRVEVHYDDGEVHIRTLHSISRCILPEENS